jgi:DeoR family transcriptional regulator, fructose operon transcriptional repressor
MKQELRKKYILNHLVKTESITVQNIVEKCGVSEITARRDLSALEDSGLLVRTHGGAIKSEIISGMFGFDKKSMVNRDNKIDICRFAASYIEDNDTIYIDCGTTTYYLSRFLTKFRNLRIITNSLPVVSELLPYSNIIVYLIGGELDNSRKALYGPMTDNLLSRYKADKAFIGAGGVSLATGVSSVDEKEISVTIKMAEAAQTVFLLCDSSKIEKDSYFTYSSLSFISYLITDKNIDPKLVNLYRSNGINILTSNL